MSEYYDGAKLLSMLDLNGKKPEIYMCTSNRSAGKTTYFSRFLVNKFIKNKEKFGLIYRFNYELDDCSDKFFKDINTLFFVGYEFTSKRKASGIYHELFLNDESCGYAISLNSADQLKKYSHLFSDISRLMMDEFQSETNHYCSDEIKKFISIHTSLARGQGMQTRYLPIYMLSNSVTLLNPYYTSLGISDRLKNDTKFLKGDGFVLEQGFLKNVSEMQKNSGFNRAFSNETYIKYSSENIYLNDNKSFIEKVTGKCRYFGTLKYNGVCYGLKEYEEQGIIYCDDNADMTFPTKLCVSTSDHDINFVMIKRNEFFISTLRYFFEHGCFRFKNLQSKECILKCLSY